MFPTEKTYKTNSIKMKQKLTIICFFIFILVSQSCSTLFSYSERTHILSSLNKSGYWGDWDAEYSLKVKGQYESNGFAFIFYDSYKHPSEFNLRVIGTYLIKKDGGWYEYSGEVQISHFYEDLGNMRNYYDKPVSPKAYLVFPCTIRVNKPIKDMIKKSGTINIFYNGVGRAYAL